MSFDLNSLDVDSVYNRFDQYSLPNERKSSEFDTILSPAIFTIRELSAVLSDRTVTLDFSKKTSEINTIARNQCIQPSSSKGVSGEAGITIEWGGKDGSSVSGYASVEAKDDNGNKAEAKVEVNSDGSGSATVSGGHDKD